MMCSLYCFDNDNDNELIMMLNVASETLGIWQNLHLGFFPSQMAMKAAAWCHWGFVEQTAL